MELETVMIPPESGLEYKVALKGGEKFAYYKPTDEWRASTMPVWKIEQAIKDAKSKAKAYEARPKEVRKDPKGPSKIEILNCLAASSEPLSCGEIAYETEINESTVVSAVRVMRKSGQIVSGKDKRTQFSRWPAKSWRINEQFVEAA